MRWVLTWKVIEDEAGGIVGRKPKARLILKGYQDPDLLFLKEDSPTLATQNRNTIWPCVLLTAGKVMLETLNGFLERRSN